MFKPHLNILPPEQAQLYHEIAGSLDSFVLYGGTALALQLGHRVSVDFDFFTPDAIIPEELYASLAWLENSQVIQRSRNTLTCLVARAGKPIQVSFFGGIDFGFLNTPLQPEATRINVASVLDIGASKLRTIIARSSYKDYVDIACILKAGVALETLLSGAKSLFSNKKNEFFSVDLALKALSFFDDLDRPLDEEFKQIILPKIRSLNIKAIQLLPVLAPTFSGPAESDEHSTPTL